MSADTHASVPIDLVLTGAIVETRGGDTLIDVLCTVSTRPARVTLAGVIVHLVGTPAQTTFG